MKKILMSLLTIAIVGALITGGAIAYFTDTETAPNNVFTAGTIDISIDPSGGQHVVTLEGYVDLKPSQTGYTFTRIHNDGTNPADIWKHIANVDNRENGITDAEQKYYDQISASKNWLLSNWIHYDLYALTANEVAWDQDDFVYRSGKNGPMDIDMTRTFAETTKWTIDLSNIPEPYYGTAVQLAIGDDTGPLFQVAVNTANPAPFYKEYPWNSPILGLPDGISMIGYSGGLGVGRCTEFEISISYEFLASKGATCWALNTEYSLAGANQFTFPAAATDIWTSSGNYYEDFDWETVISEAEGFTLTGIDGVECQLIYLGVLEPCDYLFVIQSYHLDATVDNWGQSDRVWFNMEFVAQQVEASPPAPGPELLGHGK